MLDIFNDIEEVCAFENIEYDNEGKMRLTSSIMNLKFSSGFISTIEFAMGIRNLRDFRVKFVGEEGIFYFEKGELYFEKKDKEKKRVEMEEKTRSIDTFNFLEKIKEGESDISTAIKAKRILKICLMAEISAKEKKVVKIE